MLKGNHPFYLTWLNKLLFVNDQNKQLLRQNLNLLIPVLIEHTPSLKKFQNSLKVCLSASEKNHPEDLV